MTTKPISYAFKIKLLRWMTGNYFTRGCNIVVEQQWAWAEDTSIGGTMNQLWNSIHEVREVYFVGEGNVNEENVTLKCYDRVLMWM